MSAYWDRRHVDPHPTGAPVEPPVDLHCHRRKHAVLVGAVVEVHCRHCSATAGRRVIHRWSALTGLPLDDRGEADPIPV